MAAVIEGWAAPALLDTYQIERRPVHEAVMEEAVANNAVLGGQLYRAGLEDGTAEGEALRRAVGERILAAKAREFHTLGTVLGLGYGPSPAITRDGTPPPPHGGQAYTPSARPGSLAPHAWLPDGRSLYDLFGSGFALVVSAEADAGEMGRAVADAAEQNVPLSLVRPEGVNVRTLYEADLTLVRPDQFVAWRADRWETDALQAAVGKCAIKGDIPEPAERVKAL